MNFFKQRFNLFVLVLMLVTIGSSCSNGNNNTNNTFKNPENPTEQATAEQNRQATVISRGRLICGVNGQLPGFSFVNEQGEYSGIDVDFCRAVAAALFDDPSKVEFPSDRSQLTARRSVLASPDAHSVLDELLFSSF
jgi:general L-amino acid transport system substrate-binding protein